MNDFTKEELVEIHRCLKYMIKGSVTPFSSVTMDVKKKVHCMIDNYHCDHESDGLIYTSNPPQNKCKKCGEFYR